MKRWAVLFLSVVSMAPCLSAEAPATNCLAGARIRWIIPHPIGGGYDTFFRLLTPVIARGLNAAITVENREGAGGLEGAAMLKAAKPDGHTLGALNASGLLCASLSGDTLAPDPVTDFTILARAARSRHVWLARADSEFKTFEDVVAASQKRPIVMGLRDVGSTSFISFVLGASLLDLPYRLVTGYKGSRDAVLGALRDEVDLVSNNFDSIEDQVRGGQLRIILQISVEPIADSPLLAGVPVLGGPDGWAVRRARERGADAEAIQRQVAALDELIGAGRLVVGPPGMDPALAACLEDKISAALHDPEFVATADRAGFVVEAVRGAEARRELETAAKQWDAFLPIIREAIRKVKE